MSLAVEPSAASSDCQKYIFQRLLKDTSTGSQTEKLGESVTISEKFTYQVNEITKTTQTRPFQCEGTYQKS